MVVPSRPASGGPIESAWGDIVHDAAVGIIGVTGSSGGANAAAVTFTLSPSQGRVSMVSGTDVIIPVSGWWEIFAYGQASPATGNAYRLFCDTNVSGSFASLVHAGSAGVTGWGMGLSIATIVNLVAGNVVRFRADTSVATSLTLTRFVVAYRGGDLV